MNVCMLSYSLYESDNRVIRYAETLVKQGHSVDVIALAPKGRTKKHNLRGVTLYPVQSRDRTEKSPISYLLKILVFFCRAGVLLTTLDLRKRYDLIHVHSVPDFLVFTALFPKLRGAKIILDIHDILPEFYISKFGKTQDSLIFRLLVHLERASASFAHHVIIANDIWRDKLIGRSVTAEKCSSILNYPDRSIFCRSGRARKTQNIIIMYPGTLNHHQGVDLAVRAFGLIKDDIPDAEFHIYGSGPAEKSLKSLAAQLGVNSRIKFGGGRPLPEMARLMEDADLGVVPKRGDSFGNEAFSTKSLEFMALGVPLVTADTKIDRYYFNSSIVKFFRSGDAASLADAMLSVLKSPELRSQLVQNALNYVVTNDWEHKKNVYLNIVSGLVGNRRMAGSQRQTCASD